MVCGRLGRPHGVRGLLTVEVRTDDPDQRFRVGAVLRTHPDRGAVTVTDCRWHSGRLLLGLTGVEDRTAAEAWRDTLLGVAADDRGAAGPEAWWDDQLVGLVAVDVAGQRLGVVTEVVHAPAQDLLAVRRDAADPAAASGAAGAGDGPGVAASEVLVPFVRAVVPTVDVAAGRVVLNPPAGLFGAP